jgi:hypothetical protein
MILYRQDYFALVVLIILLVVYGLEIKIKHDLSTTGFVLQEIEQEVEMVRAKNHTLKTQILQAQSLTVISTSAAELGFTEAQGSNYLYIQEE